MSKEEASTAPGAPAPGSRLQIGAVYGAGLLQGLALVTFPAASAVFTNRADYGLTTAEYGVMFAPQTIIAILVSVLGGRFVERWGAKRVFLAGLAANLASMALLVGSRFVMHHHDPALGLLLAATGLLGVGFGLTVPVVNRLAAALFPGRVNVAILALNALLGLGTALAPALIAVFVALGAWWGLPITVGVLLAIPPRRSARRCRYGRARPPPRKRGSIEEVLAVLRLRPRLRRGRDAERQLGHPLHEGRAAFARQPGRPRADAVLGGGDRGPRPLRVRRSLASRPDDVPAVAMGDRPRLRRDRAGPSGVARSRRRQPSRLAGLGCSALLPADDRPRQPRRAARRFDRLGTRSATAWRRSGSSPLPHARGPQACARSSEGPAGLRCCWPASP